MEIKNVTLCMTKAGKGYKLIAGGKWFYTSIPEMVKMLGGKSNAVTFRSLKNNRGSGPTGAASL